MWMEKFTLIACLTKPFSYNLGIVIILTAFIQPPFAKFRPIALSESSATTFLLSSSSNPYKKTINLSLNLPNIAQSGMEKNLRYVFAVHK